MIVASDLNGTLTTGAPILAVVNWIEQNQHRLRPRLFKYRILLSYFQVKVGWVESDVWANKNMRAVLNLVHSPDEDLLRSLMNFVAENELWPKRRKKVIRVIKEFHSEGAEIIIVSAAYEPAVRAFSKLISKERTTGIGTSVFLTEKGITMDDKLTTRDIKLNKVKDLIGSKILDVALGDTFADIPLLESAQKPIAVYPDRELRKVANLRGWQILE
jgi:phosphoserine phosphatase